MSAVKEEYYDCSFVSIHYIICECGETFPSENGLRAHLQKEHPHKRERKEFKCGVCGSIFSTEESCITHYEEQHFSDTDIKQEQEEQIPDHVMEVDHKQEIEITYEDEQTDHHYEQEYQHDYTDEQSFQEQTEETQQVISETEMTLEEMSQNVVTEAETVQATQLLVTANGNKQYPQILASPPKLLPVASYNFKTKCEAKIKKDEEGVLFDSLPQCAVPIRPHKRKANKQSKQCPKDIVCEVCGKKYASNAALKYHQRVHTGERPYRCHLCPKAFAMPLFLQIHVRTHTGERPFQCPDCPKAFSNRAALLRHERVHSGVKPYTCPMCYKAFTQSNSMKLHVATVHLKQPAPYKSRSRRMKEAARGLKQQSGNKIKAFAPNSSDERRASVTVFDDDPQTDGEYEVIISEEVQEEPDNTCYEVVYTSEESHNDNPGLMPVRVETRSDV